MDDTTVVVTGASRGIGAAVVRAFAAEGAHVVCCARDSNAVDAVATEVAESGGSATACRADVRDEYDLERLMEQAAREGGSVDVVVTTAATIHGSPGGMSLAEDSYAAFDDTLRTNVRGVFTAAREALPHMSSDGRILVPSGSVAREANPGMGSYAVSKAAAEALVRGFSVDIEQSVGVVDPGLVATALTDGEGRDPDEIAPLFVWAASELSADELDGEAVGLKEWRAATR